MITWFTWVQAALAMVACVFAIVQLIRNRKPDDWSVGGVALVTALLVVQVIVCLVAPLFGNSIRGDALEFWMYLISAIIIGIGAALWSIIERERWANGVLAIAAFSLAVMIVRMQQVWDASSAMIGA